MDHACARSCITPQTSIIITGDGGTSDYIFKPRYTALYS